MLTQQTIEEYRQARAEHRAARERLTETRRLLKRAHLKAVTECFNVSLGDFVKSTKDGKIYAVCDIDAFFFDPTIDDDQQASRKPWIRGYRVRKNGSHTSVAYALYNNWELVSDE